MLNQFTANAIGMNVIAGPSEATAMGNIMMQAKASGLVKDKKQIREIVRNSTSLETFEPVETELWNNNYMNYIKVFKNKT